jgi:hypothetical protein
MRKRSAAVVTTSIDSLQRPYNTSQITLDRTIGGGGDDINREPAEALQY